MLLPLEMEPKIESQGQNVQVRKYKAVYPRDPFSCTLNMDEGAQIQVERKKAQEQAEQAEQGQAETEGQRRSQRMRAQRNQSDQHSI